MSINNDPAFRARLNEAFEFLPGYLSQSAEFRDYFYSAALDSTLVPASDKMYETLPVGFISFERWHGFYEAVSNFLRNQHYGIKASGMYVRCMCIRPRFRCVLPTMVAQSTIAEFTRDNAIGNIALMPHRHVGDGRYNTVVTCSDEIDAVALALHFSN